MTLTGKNLQAKLSQMQAAYRELFLGSQTLIELNSLYWTERWLLRLVNQIARRRLEQIRDASVSLLDPDADARLKANMLEIQVEASLAGHDLGGWEATEDGTGYQAVCRRCRLSVYVSDSTVYSLLDETCPGKTNEKEH